MNCNSNSSDYYEEDDPSFLDVLRTAVLPGDYPISHEPSGETSSKSESIQPQPFPPPCNSTKRRYSEDLEEREDLPIEKNEEIYGASRFGEFGEYMHRKRAKLQIQNQEIRKLNNDGMDERKLFQGLSIYINGWTQPSVQDLRTLILKHGGIFQPYLDKKSLVTHIITCTLTPAKIQQFRNMKVARPDWLVECDRANLLLPWQKFMFVPGAQVPLLNGPWKHQKDPCLDFQPSPSTPKKRPAELISKSPEKIPVVSTSTIAATTTPRKSSAMEDEQPRYAVHESNPIAVRAMANPDWRKAHTSMASNFIDTFYKHSRLHHLATWKAELKNLVREAQDRVEMVGGSNIVWHTPSRIPDAIDLSKLPGARSVTRISKGKEKERGVEDRVIMHCDFDCFFVSAGLLARGHLKGKPVVVCHSQGRQGGTASTSEVACASYEARKFGIKNGMSLQQARRLCSGIITIPYEFEMYKDLSLKFYTILMSYADDLEAVSVDEALIDVTSVVSQCRCQVSQELLIDAIASVAETIRTQIRLATGCEVSIGISHNIQLARLATRRAKPAGSYHLVPEEVLSFLAPLCISDLHGFGPSVMKKLFEKFGVTKLGEIIDQSKAALCDALGKTTGETLYNAIRGIDAKELVSDRQRKSVSCEINYGIRFEDNQQAKSFVYKMAGEVAKRLEDAGMLGRSITLKVMKRASTAPAEPAKFLGHGVCDMYHKQVPLIGANGGVAKDSKVIAEHAWRILMSFNIDPKELRGIGIQIQKLEMPMLEAKPLHGQATLTFQRQNHSVHPSVAPSVKNDQVEDQVEKSAPVLPSYSQVDMEVFLALPVDVRKELQVEYHRHAVHDQALEVALLSPEEAVSRTRMKKQLAIGARITDNALQELDMDPEVFRKLPPSLQYEQLTMLRLAKDKGCLPSTPSERKVLRPQRKTIPKHLLWQTPPPSARFLSIPALSIQGKGKREKTALTEVSDIQEALECWLNMYRRWPPKPKDVAYVTKYLEQAIDGQTYSDVSVQQAISVLKWWLVLLRRYWGVDEHVEETCPNSSSGDSVGLIWWRIFREVKEKMDAVSRRKFGGCLSLK